MMLYFSDGFDQLSPLRLKFGNLTTLHIFGNIMLSIHHHSASRNILLSIGINSALIRNACVTKLGFECVNCFDLVSQNTCLVLLFASAMYLSCMFSYTNTKHLQMGILRSFFRDCRDYHCFALIHHSCSQQGEHNFRFIANLEDLSV